MFILYGIQFENDSRVYYTTKENLDIWSEMGAFKIVKKQLVFDNVFLNKVFKINLDCLNIF
jgi:3-phenylpropionate/cinnamic acid dioxygenase small subunit